ncbi:Sensor for unfolded proteins in the ER [Podosphaera aphanis]|nr:Sensor for unfolded proteins in the ER [Podosphaera aphanis]
MPLRRLARDFTFLVIISVITIIPWLIEAQQQQRQYIQKPYTEEPELDLFESSDKIAVVRHTDTPHIHSPQKNPLISYKHENHANAIATLAPAKPAVAAPFSRLQPSVNAGLSSPQIARSLWDWEVEDFVLLATVDGKLYARDRKTGKERWHISHEQPMVQTRYHSRNYSDTLKHFTATALDDYLWIVEPTRDGSLYIYRPNGPSPGLANTGLTMKKIVEEMAPYGDEDPPVIYTGEKKTHLLTVDANTGKVLSWFGAMNSLTKDICAIDADKGIDKCPKTATITLGRTEYTVGIFSRNDGHHIATLTFSEWSPNNYDQDLHYQYTQYASTMDNKYIYTRHDGRVIGFDLERSAETDGSGLLFNQKFSSPVVRIFDVARPWGSDKATSNLVVLPQPQPPFIEEKESALIRDSSVFLNHTDDGSWYAMSGKSYPLITGGIQRAQCNEEEWLQRQPQWNILDKNQLSEALVGLHLIENNKFDNKIEAEEILTISAPTKERASINSSFNTPQSALAEDIRYIKRFHQLSQIVTYSLIEFFQNPVLLLLLLGILISNQRSISTVIRDSYSITSGKVTKDVAEDSKFQSASINQALSSGPKIGITTIDDATQISMELGGSKSVIPQKPESHFDSAKIENSGEEKPCSNIESPKKKEKKAHRGRRGGVKHKKGNRNNVQERSVTPRPKMKPISHVGDNFEESQKMLSPAKAELDFQNSFSEPHEISGPIIRIGALEVNTDKLIGTGSNGTMVFEGTFDGREVAVKRMLIQFFDIAFQETKLLRESDNHPNVIRYFAQQQAAGFLYIALELCPASLADVIEKPLKNHELAQAGERDLPNVLYQIANGIRHLHKLRIVHRDLKPQNILVSIGKDGKPRLLVSDFGLCKKLESEQSSFRATTAHAAGTSGWRAPELLLDDDAKNGQTTVVDASTDSNSDSILPNTGLFPSRRATRAIDIFSLGLIFFYVLTKGYHPFDCGDRFMREVNIRQGKYDLRALEVLGDYTYEAKDLIGSMLAAEPKGRPYAHQVMAHPFFWNAKKRLNFLCDVSDHFEKEQREPPSPALQELESYAPGICGNDFLKLLGKDFVESMGKQRKYTGTKLLDLLRALRNKRNHYEDLSEKLKREVGPLPDGYLSFWTRRFPQMLMVCWTIVYDLKWDETDRFKEYFEPGTIEL